MESLPEINLCQSLGISRADLKNLRREILKENTHFFKKGKAVWITPAGQITIEKHLKEASIEAPKDKPSQCEPSEATATACVEKISPNKMILICKIDSQSGCRVRVKDNSKFVIGMTFRVKPMREANLWTIDGNCPRWRGRW